MEPDSDADVSQVQLRLSTSEQKTESTPNLEKSPESWLNVNVLQDKLSINSLRLGLCCLSLAPFHDFKFS